MAGKRLNRSSQKFWVRNMCTYSTIKQKIEGSAKGPGGSWMSISEATVYFDHPSHSKAEHTLNVDLWDADQSSRVGIELTAASAAKLIQAIRDAFDEVPAGMTTVFLSYNSSREV